MKKLIAILFIYLFSVLDLLIFVGRYWKSFLSNNRVYEFIQGLTLLIVNFVNFEFESKQQQKWQKMAMFEL